MICNWNILIWGDLLRTRFPKWLHEKHEAPDHSSFFILKMKWMDEHEDKDQAVYISHDDKNWNK